MRRRQKRHRKEKPSTHKALAAQADAVCERCGRPMVDLQVPNLADEGGPRHILGRQCLGCGQVIDTHSLGRHTRGGLGEEEQRR